MWQQGMGYPGCSLTECMGTVPIVWLSGPQTAYFHTRFPSSWVAEKASKIVAQAPGADISKPLASILFESFDRNCKASWEDRNACLDKTVAEVTRRVDEAISQVIGALARMCMMLKIFKGLLP